MMQSPLFVLALVGLCMPTLAQAPQLLKDINVRRVPTPSDPEPMFAQKWIGLPTFSVLGTRVLVSATTPVTGREMFVVDVASATSRLVRDIQPGKGSSNPRSVRLAKDGKRAFFVARDGRSGFELWVTDGSSAGTRLVKDINPGSASSAPTELVAFGPSSVVFAATSAKTGQEIYISDGTSAGTRILKDIAPGSTSSKIAWLRSTRDGKKVLFQANDGTKGAELWVTDGTGAGTKMVKDLIVGTIGSSPKRMTPLGSSRVLLNASNGRGGSDLWITDGTGTNTRLARLNGTNLDLFGAMAIGDRVLCSGDSKSRLEPHITDGTSKGTFELIDTCPGPYSGGMGFPHLGTSGKKFYWTSTGSACGFTIFVSDGTAAGSKPMVSKIWPTRSFSMVELGGKIYFQGQDVTKGTGTELCVSDGTVAGTKTLRDTYPGSKNGGAQYLTRINPAMAIYVADDGQAGTELWIMTLGKAFKQVEINKPKMPSTKSSYPVFFSRFRDALIFSASSRENSRDIWTTDGSTKGTHRMAVIPSSSEFAESRGNLFFMGTSINTGRELWTSDGTAAGTRLVKDIRKGKASSWPRGLTAIGGKVYFAADSGGTGSEPWVSDGTAQGTFQLKEIAKTFIGSNPRGFAGMGDRVVFSAYRTDHGYEPYITDGTKAGTRLLKDIYPGMVSSHGGTGVFMGGKLYFKALSPASGWELWVTDFTTNGTKLFMDILPGSASSMARPIGARDGRLYMWVTDASSKLSIWASDGTKAGTRLFLDYEKSGTARHWGFAIPVGGRRIYFGAKDSIHGAEIVVSDGTPNGTSVREIWPGPADGIDTYYGLRPHITLGSKVLVPGRHPHYGFEPFVIDNGATAEPVGSPHGSTWIHGSDPVMGSTAGIAGGTSLSSAFHVSFYGSVTRRSVEFGQAGSLHISLTRHVGIIGVTQGPRFAHTLRIPNTPAIQGVEVMLQALAFDVTNLQGTLELSNGLHWAIGR